MTEEEFSNQMLDKFPDLFPKDEYGKTYCPCGIYVPAAWQIIVEGCLTAINEYAQFQSKRKKRKKRIWPLYYTFNSLYNALRHIANFVSPDKIWRKEGQNPADLEGVRSKHKIREWMFQKAIRAAYFFLYHSRVDDKKEYEFPQIAQIKEKFGTLRIYFDCGCDSFIDGMVFYATLAARNIDPYGNPPVVVMPEDVPSNFVDDDGNIDHHKVCSEFASFCNQNKTD